MPGPIKRRVRTSRKTAEALRLEVERLARRLGISAGVRVRRLPEAGPRRRAAAK